METFTILQGAARTWQHVRSSNISADITVKDEKNLVLQVQNVSFDLLSCTGSLVYGGNLCNAVRL